MKMSNTEKQFLANGLSPDALAALIDGSHSVHFDHKQELIHVYYLGINNHDDGHRLTLKPAITFSACDIIESPAISKAMRAAWESKRCYDVPTGPREVAVYPYGISATGMSFEL